MAQRYLYHFAPANMQGDRLYPLNRLKSVHPECYEAHCKKYNGREALMERNIPLLDVLWNDVLHLSPMCPDIIYSFVRQSEDVGMMHEKPYLKVPVEVINPDKTVVYHYRKDQVNHTVFEGEELEEEFSWFDSDRYEELTAMMPIQQKHYQRAFKENKRPLTYVGVPHVLTTEPIKLADCERVDL